MSGFRGGESSGFSSGGRGAGVCSGESAGGQFARRSPYRAQYGDGRSRSFELQRRDDHGLPFVVLVLFQLERDGSLVVVFVVVVLVGKVFRIVLTPLLSKWLSTGFTLLVLTPVLSCLFVHVLVFEFQVGDLKNIWLIDSGCSRHMTGDKGWFSSLVMVLTKRYITFGDNGRGRVLSEGEIKVSDKITLRRVALV
jgi:hypothetical protein